MADIKKIKIGNDIYDVRDASAARASDLAAKQDSLTVGNGIAIDSSDIIRTTGIPFGTVDDTSTSTAYTATVPGIYKLEDGVCCMLKNGVVTSAAGFTINVNGLGAKPVYNSMAAATADTTIFNINYTMLFVYDSTRVSDGCWICYRGYNSDADSLAYRIRHNSSTLPTTAKFYRYRILFTSADGTHYVPSNTSTSTNATAKRDVNQTPIDPFGEILYYATTTVINAEANPAAAQLWSQNVCVFGYSFNRTGAALVLLYPKPVYLKCAPQSNGSAIIDATTPYVQALPAASDDKIYIFLGIAYDETHIELLKLHPIYYHDGTGIRIWTGKNIPTKTSELTNDSNFISSTSLATVATSGSYNDLTDKPTIPTSADINAAKPFIITITPTYGEPTTYSADKTFAEITSAYDDGRDLLVNCENYYYNLKHVANNKTLFDFELIDSENRVGQLFTITAQSIAYEEYYYQSPLTFDNLPTANSNNPVKSGGVYSALANKADKTVIGTLTGIYDEDDEFVIGYTCDKTFSELYTAFNNGTQVILSETEDINTYFFLTYCSSSDLYFRTLPSSQFSFWLIIDDQNTISYGVYRFQPLLTFDNTPTQNSNNPVKSGGIYTELLNKANKIAIVNLSSTTGNGTTYSADKTFDEILAIIEEGSDIKVLKEDNYYNLIYYDDTVINFSLICPESLYCEEIEISEENVINIFTRNLQSLLTTEDAKIINITINYNSTTGVLTIYNDDEIQLAHQQFRYIANNYLKKITITYNIDNSYEATVSRNPLFDSTDSWDFYYIDFYQEVILTLRWDSLNNCVVIDEFIKNELNPILSSYVPTTRKINNKPLSSDITLTANDIGAATVSDVNTAISNLIDSAPTTLNTLNELATALGNDPNFATTITNKIAALQVHVGSVAGKLYRNNVGGSGNFTVSGNSGCIPNLTAGTFLVSIYAKSATQSYTFRFNFGSSVTYDLSTTNGEISDVRQITIPSSGTFSGLVLNGSVASGTILYVVMYNYLTPISTVGIAAVTNRYADLDGTPTIPTVNNGTLTIQKNGTTVQTFTANLSSSVTANITVPTTASDVGAVPTTRKVNNKELSSDITLTASDVGALPSNTVIPSVINNLTTTTTGSALDASQGKALKDLVDGKTSKFVVGFTLSGTTISNPTKTFALIKAAYDAGNLVLASDDADSLYYLLYCETTNCEFFCCDSSTLYDINVDSSNTWTYHKTDISQLELHLSDKSQITHMQKINNVWKKATYNNVTGVWSVDNTDLTTGNTKNIYLDIDNNDLYYWNGSAFTLLSEDKVLSDWNLTDNTKVDYIKNKPSIPTTASDINAMSTSHAANAITSNDINNWNSKADVLTLVTVSGSGSVTLALDANKFYKFGSVTALTLTLNAPTSGLAIYGGKFTASADDIAITLPSGVTIPDNTVSIQSAHEYEFNILDNVYIMMDITTTT